MSDFNYKKYLKNNPLLQKEAEETKLITEEKTTTEESDIKEVNESVSVLAGIGALLGSTAGLAKLLDYMQKNYPDQVDKFVKMVDKGNKASYSRLGEDEVSEDQKEEMSSKMKKSELKSKIKEDIISLLQEDEIEYETPLEEEEEVEIDIEDKVEVEEPELDASVAQTGLSDDEKEIQDALKLAYDNAQAIGDEKLADQIGNSITFFTRTHVVER